MKFTFCTNTVLSDSKECIVFGLSNIGFFKNYYYMDALLTLIL